MPHIQFPRANVVTRNEAMGWRTSKLLYWYVKFVIRDDQGALQDPEREVPNFHVIAAELDSRLPAPE